jgi:NAD+ synthase
MIGEKMKKLICDITKWLHDYCEDFHMDGFVVGVSGGIDSAVTSALCAETGLPVRAVIIPINRGLNVIQARWLTIKYQNVVWDIVDIFRAYEEFTMAFSKLSDLTRANIQSRLRMVTLYAIANENNMLVCGTGNKVEDFGAGFFTKYGDGGVDIAPIADCMKSEVYAMGKELGILPEILKAKPTDDLWADGRTDEDQLGATYDELEWAMKYKYNTELTKREEEVLKIYMELQSKNRHKWEAIPVFKRNV